jgi:alkylation response protein AidB-like acyl-CoA dehydrogenase
VYSDAGVSDTHWAAFTELGLTALPVPEEQGGFNGSPVDMLVVMQELGRALVVEPYWATAVGIEALRIAGSAGSAGSAQGEDAVLLERAAQGEIKLAVAFHEPHARYDLFSVDTAATQQGEQYVLNGKKSVVLHGAQADHWIVPAR